MEDRYGTYKKIIWKSMKGPYGSYWLLYRVGNLVIVRSAGGTGFSKVGQWEKNNEKMPDGFKPENVGYIQGFCPPSGLFAWHVDHSGGISMMVERNDIAADYEGWGAWLTVDEWPQIESGEDGGVIDL